MKIDYIPKTYNMKITRLSFVLLIIIFMSSFAGLKSRKYCVEIVQDGKSLRIINNKVELEKKPFQIRITLFNHDGVYMSASFGRDYFDLKSTDEIKDYKYLSSKTRAEPSFNAEKDLVVHPELVSYLFYNAKMDWHRFDKDVTVKGKQVTGTKTINQIWDQEADEFINITDINKNIFLFFVATKARKNGKLPQELGRLKVQLTWK